MHNRWRELIPFYVAGTLEDTEANHLQQHLTACEDCRDYLQEWQEIGTAARQEGAVAAQHRLPPLAIQLTSQAEAPPPHHYTNGHHKEPLHLPTRRTVRPTGSRLSLTMVAASIMMIGFVGMMLLSNRTQNTQSASQIALPCADATTENQRESCVTTIPENTNVEACIVQHLSDAPVTLYETYEIGSDIVATIGVETDATVTARTDADWYRVRHIENDAVWVGWVDSNSVELAGSCESIPFITLPTQDIDLSTEP